MHCTGRVVLIVVIRATEAIAQGFRPQHSQYVMPSYIKAVAYPDLRLKDSIEDKMVMSVSESVPAMEA